MKLRSRERRPGRSAWPLRVALSTTVALLAGACGSPGASGPAVPAATAAPATAVAVPGTPAGAQLRWLTAAMARLPLSSAQLRAHFDTAFLAQVSPAGLNQALQAMASLRLLSIQASELSTVVADVTIGGAGPPAQVFLAVDRQGLISWLRISPAPAAPSPATWAGVDAALRSAAPQVRLLVADVTGGSCQPVHGLDPGTPAPLAAAVKLYVLDALGQAVAAGTAGWNQPLTVTAPLKSLPPGELQDEPDGTRLSVLDTAAAMMSLSDNTATDMLINLLGRPAVEAALTQTGMADPALDRPFLTTREIFTLKLRHWPALAGRYLAAGQAGRRALLAGTVDRAPLPSVAAAGSWVAPRAVTSLEYFASASDLCRVYAALSALARRPGLAPIGQLLSLNDDGLQLDPARWRTTWFKGGSEPGVLTLAFLATTQAGHSYAVTVLADDPSQPINQTTAIPAILSAVKAAFTLAARTGHDAIYTAANRTRSSRQPPELNRASALTRRPGSITRQKPASHRAHATPQGARCPVSPMLALAGPSRSPSWSPGSSPSSPPRTDLPFQDQPTRRTIMNTIHRIHHLISILAAGARALLVSVAAVPPAVARTKSPRRSRRVVAGPATLALLSLGLLAVAPQFSSPASAQGSSRSCATPVTSAPAGPATVATASTSFGKVLVVGSGANAGCSLYILTSDELHSLTLGLAPYACSDGPNVIGHPCDTVLWPALLTNGAPIAGPGVNPALLGTVTRTDVLSGHSVQQVTYAGLPLYRFFLDETPGQTDGANLFDPVTSPAGIWYLVQPGRGHPAPGRLQLRAETVNGATVLAASMDNDLSLLPHGSFPAYTLTNESSRACQSYCALIWPPVLTSGRPEAGPGVDQHALGVLVRPDGTRQVTYHGKPLYLFIKDAYIPGITGTQSINGAGAVTPWGVFNTIPLT